MSQNGFGMNNWAQQVYNSGSGTTGATPANNVLPQFSMISPYNAVGNWCQPVSTLLNTLGQSGAIAWGPTPQPQTPQVQTTLNYLSNMVAPPLFSGASGPNTGIMSRLGMLPSSNWMYQIPVYVPKPIHGVGMSPNFPSGVPSQGAFSASVTPQISQTSLLTVLIAALLQKGKQNVNNSQNNDSINTTNKNDKVRNTGDQVTIDTKDGDDEVSNDGDDCDISAGDGNDTVHNTGNKDTIRTGTGDDEVTNSGAENDIATEDGNDHIVNSGNKNTISGGAGNDTLENTSGNENVIKGDTGNDTLKSTNGSRNTMEGGEGDDTINVTGGSQNVINGNGGTDTITVSNSHNNTINGGTGTDTIVVSDSNGSVITGGDGNDDVTLRNTDTTHIAGGNGDDKVTLDGTNNKNVTLAGGAGTDTVVINGGISDYVQEIKDGGVRAFTHKTSHNKITVGGDVETIQFTDGSQVSQNIDISGSNTAVSTGDADDTVSNAGDKNTMNTGGGNDTVSNTGAENTINTGAGNDTLNNSGDKNTMNTGDGADKVTNNGHQNTMTTGTGDDEVLNRGNNNSIRTEDGDDQVTNHGNHNTIDTGIGDDEMINNAGENNRLSSGDGDDQVTNNNGKNNLIETGDGDDQIDDIGSTNNTIHAGAGHDSLTMTNSTNTHVNMGSGDDEVLINSTQNGPATIQGGEGDDTVRLSGSISDYTVELTDQGYQTYTSRADATKSTRIMDDVEHVTFANGQDNGQSLVINNSNQTINTGNAVDTVINNGNHNTINTTGGDDTVTNNGANNTINTGGGNDTVNNNGAGNEIHAGDGNDTITNRGNQNRILTEGGDDVMTNFGNANTLDGGVGNDTITNNGGSNNTIVGGEGNDKIINNGGHNNKIDAGNGTDCIESINGNNNTLCGGAGNDTMLVDGGTGNLVNAGGGDNTITLRNSNGTKVESSGGNDTILMDGFQNKNVTICGGAGNDKVTFTGVPSQYTVVTESDGRRTVTHITSGNKTTVGKDVDTIHFTATEQSINGVNAGGHGTIWGDPHFMDMNNNQRIFGVNFDIMGEVGKTYNLLSDKNIQMNGKFSGWGGNHITIVSQMGLRLSTADGEKQVQADANGTVKINGQTLTNGQQVNMNFINGQGQVVSGFIKVIGKRVSIETDEYVIGADLNGSHINTDVKVKAEGVLKDYVAPHGLLGQTADGDGISRKGRAGSGAQGQGVIEGTYNQYEVSSLFGTDDQFSRYGKTGHYVADENDIDRDSNIVEAKALTINGALTAIFDTVSNIWRTVRRDAQGHYVVDVDTNNDKIADTVRVIDSNLYLNS